MFLGVFPELRMNQKKQTKNQTAKEQNDLAPNPTPKLIRGDSLNPRGFASSRC
jgi:hypothetical protein